MKRTGNKNDPFRACLRLHRIWFANAPWYGAAHQTAEDSFFDEILHYMYEGDSALHMAAAAYQKEIAIDLIEAGADPNSLDKSGVAPLHRAVRMRCAAAVEALLEGGADACARNKSGSTPLLLARQNTGRGGSGSPEARAQQEEILPLLQAHGAT